MLSIRRSTHPLITPTCIEAGNQFGTTLWEPTRTPEVTPISRSHRSVAIFLRRGDAAVRRVSGRTTAHGLELVDSVKVLHFELGANRGGVDVAAMSSTAAPDTLSFDRRLPRAQIVGDQRSDTDRRMPALRRAIEAKVRCAARTFACLRGRNWSQMPRHHIPEVRLMPNAACAERVIAMARRRW